MQLPRLSPLVWSFVVAAVSGNSVAYAAESIQGTSDKSPAQFEVLEYRVLGNTRLPGAEIETLLYPLLGATKAISDVEQARSALESHYHERGYGTVFVDIPEQQIADGVVRLKVTEGRLDHVHLVGARYFSGRAIRKAVPEATDGIVPQLPVLQQQLGALNSATVDRSVTPVLKAGATPGTVELALNVKEQLPLHASITVNDKYSPDTSRLRANFSVSYDNVLGRLGSLAAQFQTSPQQRSEVDVLALSYTARLTAGGNRLAFFFVDSKSNVATAGDGGTGINVVGKGKIYGTRLILPLVSGSRSSHAVIGGLEYKDFTESVFSSDLVLTPIKYVNVSVGHSSGWREPRSLWTLNSSANLGVRGSPNNSEAFRIKRFRAVPNYFLLRSDGTMALRLPAKLALRLNYSGQYAVDSIISNEQLSIAGADGVRGYMEAEQLGDVGIRSSVEFGTQDRVVWPGSLHADVFGFFDYGHMTRRNPLRQQDPITLALGNYLERQSATLQSVGLGFHVSVTERFDGDFAWAYPLSDIGAETGTHRGDQRLHFSLRASW
jgi:hemolysin activation/secretion protein